MTKYLIDWKSFQKRLNEITLKSFVCKFGNKVSWLNTLHRYTTRYFFHSFKTLMVNFKPLFPTKTKIYSKSFNLTVTIQPK